MASLSLPSAQAGHDNKVLGKRKMEEEEQHEEQQEEKEQEDGKSEASVEGPKLSVGKPRWNIDEDTMLIKHISINGSKNWKLISDQLEGRSPASCRMRWWGQLCPKLLKVYNETKAKYQASAAVPPPTPIFTVRNCDSYEEYLTWVMNRYRNRVHLAISSYTHQEATSSYQPQLWTRTPPPPPPASPSSPPTFIDFLGVGSV